MVKSLAIGALCSLVLATGALADEGRFSIKPAGDGFIKLDKQTGALTHCQQVDATWTCKILNDKTGDLSASAEQVLEDAAKVKQENKALRAKVARLEERLAKLEKGPGELQLPSDQDVEKLMGFFERMMERFLAFARKMQEQPGEPT